MFRHGGERGFLDDVPQWFIYLEKRNLTVHTYDQQCAAQVFEVIPDFVKSVEYLLARLNAKHD